MAGSCEDANIVWRVAWKPGYGSPHCFLDNALAKRLPHNEEQQLGTLPDNDWIVTLVHGVRYKVLQEPT
jgi:hypothetical protein